MSYQAPRGWRNWRLRDWIITITTGAVALLVVTVFAVIAVTDGFDTGYDPDPCQTQAHKLHQQHPEQPEQAFYDSCKTLQHSTGH